MSDCKLSPPGTFIPDDGRCELCLYWNNGRCRNARSERCGQETAAGDTCEFYRPNAVGINGVISTDDEIALAQKDAPRNDILPED